MPAIGIANRRNSKLPEPPSGAKPNILSMKSISISQFTTCSLDTLRFAKVRVKGYQVRKRAQSSVRATNGLEDDKPMLRKILDQSFARPSEYSRCKTSSIDSQPHGSPCKRPAEVFLERWARDGANRGGAWSRSHARSRQAVQPWAPHAGAPHQYPLVYEGNSAKLRSPVISDHDANLLVIDCSNRDLI
jgi:hypothetical protein